MAPTSTNSLSSIGTDIVVFTSVYKNPKTSVTELRLKGHPNFSSKVDSETMLALKETMDSTVKPALKDIRNSVDYKCFQLSASSRDLESLASDFHTFVAHKLSIATLAGMPLAGYSVLLLRPDFDEPLGDDKSERKLLSEYGTGLTTGHAIVISGGSQGV